MQGQAKRAGVESATDNNDGSDKESSGDGSSGEEQSSSGDGSSGEEQSSSGDGSSEVDFVMRLPTCSNWCAPKHLSADLSLCLLFGWIHDWRRSQEDDEEGEEEEPKLKYQRLGARYF